jgi:hypothetical protein
MGKCLFEKGLPMMNFELERGASVWLNLRPS